jgi:predicted MFS family arabinose efflux permease
MALFRNRTFVLLCAGQTVSMVGTQVSQLALPLLVLDLSGSPALTGVFVALRTIPPLLLLLPAGARVMLLSDAARALVLGSVPITLALGGPILPLLGIVALVEGAFNTFFTVAETACLPQVVSQDQLPRAISIDNTSDQISRMVGPTLGGALYGLGRSVPFAIDAISYAVSVVSLLFIRVPFQQPRSTSPRTESLVHEIRAGLRYLAHHRVLRVLVILVGGLNFCSYGYPLIMIVRAQELGAEPSTIGLMFASGGIGGIVGALLAPKLLRRYGVGTTMLVASWVWVLTWPPFALAPSLPWLALTNAVGWIIVPIHGITQLSYRLKTVPDGLQGRVNSIYRLIAFGGQPVALALSGLLLQSFGPVATIWLIALPQAALVLVTTLGGYLRNIDRGSRPPSGGGQRVLGDAHEGAQAVEAETDAAFHRA